ncbi:hypothetical protein C8A03DRAFT_19700 [Achaetomium macrosporum]|uniref:Uncharacterized protein n=1 Tax=Achaetomium macrosporum TaxID=79813 RepID=A0AAN7C0P4_9PEZI|nr:hypothetical protein C8A03DRAFT_19700 [Achaetomium macrosporum]
MRARQYWRVNAFEGHRSVAFHSRFNERENIRGNPTRIQFTTPCPYQTIIYCFELENGGGYFQTVNVAANSGYSYDVGFAFKSWMVMVNPNYP